MWPDPSETDELLRQAADGDGAAVDSLLGRYRQPLRRMVDLRLDKGIARRLDASDVVQDVLVEASRRLAQYLASPALPFPVWLRQLAKDHVIAAYRRHRLALRRSVDRERHPDALLADRSSIDLVNQLAAGDLTPAAAAIRKELERRFQDALELLNEGDREVILMRHFEGLSNQEVAQNLGLSDSAAGMRYLRALRRLRDILGTDGEASQ